MHRQLNRRNFLRSVACSGAGLIILQRSQLVRGTQANEKLNIAGIGIGGRGAADVNGVASENLVAMRRRPSSNTPRPNDTKTSARCLTRCTTRSTRWSLARPTIPTPRQE